MGTQYTDAGDDCQVFRHPGAAFCQLFPYNRVLDHSLLPTRVHD